MAYVKGEQIEPGIWRLADKEDIYLAEVHYRDPHTANIHLSHKPFLVKKLRKRYLLDSKSSGGSIPPFGAIEKTRVAHISRNPLFMPKSEWISPTYPLCHRATLGKAHVLADRASNPT